MTKNVAYLACKYSLPASADRRVDAYEHDLEMAAFRETFMKQGLHLSDVDWLDDGLQNRPFDLFFVRSTWDYTERPQQFLEALRRLSLTAPVANDPDVIEWNMAKHYLAELETAGLPVIPSYFVSGNDTKLSDIQSALGTAHVILKPVFGGGGFGQSKIGPDDHPDQIVPEGIFGQPFIREISSNGEISFIFVGEEFSHCVKKTAAAGEYRIQTYHGGFEESYAPTTEEVDMARTFIQAMPKPALACRVDWVPTAEGPKLMELEAIEPHLFPQFGDRLPLLLADRIHQLLAQ